jgi:hypothetical protein
MVTFLYPRRDKHHQKQPLPHSHAFEHSRKPHHTQTSTITQTTGTKAAMSSVANEPHTHPGAPDLNTYTRTMRRWTLCQLKASATTTTTTTSPSSSRQTNCYYMDIPPYTQTIVSPLYPTNSSLYECSVSVSSSHNGHVQDEDALGDVGTTPCNTPRRNKGLRRRSTVAAEAAARKRARDEIADQGHGQARLRPVELVRSLSCAA